MDEHEFRRVLELFPIVRSRDFHLDSGSSSQSSSQAKQKVDEKKSHDKYTHRGKRDLEIQGNQDDFWEKLKVAVEKKVSANDAEQFCKAFKQVYNKFVYEEMSLDAARSFLNSQNT